MSAHTDNLTITTHTQQVERSEAEQGVTRDYLLSVGYPDEVVDRMMAAAEPEAVVLVGHTKGAAGLVRYPKPLNNDASYWFPVVAYRTVGPFATEGTMDALQMGTDYSALEMRVFAQMAANAEPEATREDVERIRAEVAAAKQAQQRIEAALAESAELVAQSNAAVASLRSGFELMDRLAGRGIRYVDTDPPESPPSPSEELLRQRERNRRPFPTGRRPSFPEFQRIRPSRR